VVALLKAGLDPWETSDVWAEAEKEQIYPLLELKADLEPVAIKAYPPAPEPIINRCVKCISQF
jgi:hypothetical protein